jgi:uncharacterized phage protein (TIGR01671 family)
MKQRDLKFRVWNIEHKCWDSPAILEVWDDEGSLEPFEYIKSGTLNPLYVPKENYIIQQYVGIQDRNKKDIYEGDIVKFKYSVGDFAWEFMSEEDIAINQTMLGKQYVGVVSPDVLVSSNMNIICGDPKSTHMTFPMVYGMHSKIIGNIFENLELLK